MANRLINPGSRHFNAQGTSPLSGGLMYFYEPGTLNLKDTYSAESAAPGTENTNPVVLSAGGLEPNIFLDGGYRVILKDSTGVQIWDRDDVNTTPLSPWQQWVPSISYPVDWVVIGSDGYFYVSQVNNNITNDPTSSPTEWKLFVEQIGFDGTVNGNVYVVDTSDDQGIGNVTKNVVRALVPISTVVAANVATVDFTGITSDFSDYMIRGLNVSPQTDGQSLLMRTSSNGGSAYDSGASDYTYSTFGSGATAAQIVVVPNTGNVGTNEPGSTFLMTLINPSNSATAKAFLWDAVEIDSSTAIRSATSAAVRSSTSAVNAVRFFFGSGNIASGIFTLYGVRRT